MDYVIRPCREDDLVPLIGLCKAHAEYESNSYITEGKAEKLKTALFAEPPKIYCYVVDSGENLAGYFTYTFDFSTWDASLFLHLDCLYLELSSRGHGVGQEIINMLKEIARANNCVNIQWQTPVFNDRAIKFYKRVGGTGKEKIRFYL